MGWPAVDPPAPGTVRRPPRGSREGTARDPQGVGLVFGLGAVTVAGFAAGTAAAALLLLHVGSLLPILAGAAVLALWFLDWTAGR